MRATERSRFDTRLSKEQKDYFEYAATLAGFKTMTDFVLSAAQQQADSIVEKHNQILASQKDQELFFDALITPQEPNDSLKIAASRFRNALSSK